MFSFKKHNFVSLLGKDENNDFENCKDMFIIYNIYAQFD